MNKFFRITWHEYTRHVFRRRFLLALFSVPLMILLMIVLVISIIRIESKSTPVGYVDHSGLLAAAIPQPAVKWPQRNVSMQAYPDETAATADLKAGKLQVYFIIPADYLQSGQAQEVYLTEPKGTAVEQFISFLTTNLLAGQPPQVANRIQAGMHLTIQSADNRKETSENSIVNLILPFLAGILFIVGMTTSSGYLMQAVVEEKENRTMEIMITSVSPGQLMSGKVIADIAVGVTQLIVWSIFIVIGLVVGKSYLSFLNGLQFSGQTIGILILVMVPAFIMISGLMAAVGATVTEASEAQQFMGLFTIPIWIPYILVGTFIQNPNSLLAIILSFFPLTAPMTIAMRIGFASIPTWQLIVSELILVLSAMGAVWLAGRAFRLGMLRYGQRLRWKEIFKRQTV